MIERLPTPIVALFGTSKKVDRTPPSNTKVLPNTLVQ
jgi:hypothetical protein